MNGATLENAVLAIYPFSRGFAFVLFAGPDAPFDWGVKEVKEKHRNTKTLEEIKKIIDLYVPTVLVIEDTTDKESRRSSRIRNLYRKLARLAEAEDIGLFRYSKLDVRDCFASLSAHTKYEIAKAVAAKIPGFAHRMPRYRKVWMSEDPRQSLFDAAALGLTFFFRCGEPNA